MAKREKTVGDPKISRYLWLRENCILLILRCVVPFLDFTKSYTLQKASMLIELKITDDIHDWHAAYIRSLSSGFIPDPSTRTVRTSTYPDPGTIMSPPILVPLNPSGPRPATAARPQDIDSLVCSYCGFRRHTKKNCHRKEKAMKRLHKKSLEPSDIGSRGDVSNMEYMCAFRCRHAKYLRTLQWHHRIEVSKYA